MGVRKRADGAAAKPKSSPVKHTKKSATLAKTGSDPQSPSKRRISKADLENFDISTIPSPDNVAEFKQFTVPWIRLKLQVLKEWAAKNGVKVGKDHISKFFESADKAKLWQIFAEKRKKSDNTDAKQAYDQLAESK